MLLTKYAHSSLALSSTARSSLHDRTASGICSTSLLDYSASTRNPASSALGRNIVGSFHARGYFECTSEAESSHLCRLSDPFHDVRSWSPLCFRLHLDSPHAPVDVPLPTYSSPETGASSLAMFTIPRKPASTSITSSRGLTAGEDALLSELQKINAALSSQPVTDQTLSSFKANTLLQFLGILAATVFGVFSILAWLAATKSNEISSNALSQALQSNQLALLAYCVSGGNSVRQRVLIPSRPRGDR
jgi:hypothetical protein